LAGPEYYWPKPMITAHVNELGIILRFGSMAENLTSGQWEALLNELKSHYIPSFYQYGKRLHVDMSRDGTMRAVIYFTPQTATLDEAIEILRKRGIDVKDVRENPSGK
jgi:hypothetical protein